MVQNAVAEKIGESPDKIKKKNVDWAAEIIKKGVIIELHIGRTRFVRQMTKEDLGIDIPDAEFQKFVAEYYDLGSKLLIPKRILSLFNRIESQARNNLYKHSFNTPWGLFVPQTAYAKWKEKNEEVKANYIAEAQKLKEEIPALKNEILAEYRNAASKLYERTAKIKTPEEFTEEFLKNLEAQIPAGEEVERSFYYDEDIFYIPLPSEVEEELLKAEVSRREANIERAKTEGEIEKVRSEVQMHKDTVKKILETKQQKMDSLIDTVSVELRRAVFMTLKDVLEGIKSKSKIPGSSVKRLNGLIEKTRMMNFMNDSEIENALVKIESALSGRFVGASLGDTALVFHDIAREFRLAAAEGEDDLPEIRENRLLL